jgi:hypothetical protein
MHQQSSVRAPGRTNPWQLGVGDDDEVNYLNFLFQRLLAAWLAHDLLQKLGFLGMSTCQTRKKNGDAVCSQWQQQEEGGPEWVWVWVWEIISGRGICGQLRKNSRTFLRSFQHLQVS